MQIIETIIQKAKMSSATKADPIIVIFEEENIVGTDKKSLWHKESNHLHPCGVFYKEFEDSPVIVCDTCGMIKDITERLEMLIFLSNGGIDISHPGITEKEYKQQARERELELKRQELEIRKWKWNDLDTKEYFWRKKLIGNKQYDKDFFKLSQKEIESLKEFKKMK